MVDVKKFPEIQALEKEPFIKTYVTLKITVSDINVTDNNVFEANNQTAQLAKLRKEIENAKKAKIEPLKEQLKTIEAPYKTLLNEIEKLETCLRDKLLAYHAERERKQAEMEKEQRRIQEAEIRQRQLEAEAKGDIETSQALERAITYVQTAPIVTKSYAGMAGEASSFTTVRWKYKIIDPDAVCKYHPELCEPSPGKINRFVQQHKENAVGKLKGIDVYPEKSLTVMKTNNKGEKDEYIRQ